MSADRYEVLLGDRVRINALAMEGNASVLNITYNTRDFAGVEQFGLRAIEPGAFL